MEGSGPTTHPPFSTLLHAPFLFLLHSFCLPFIYIFIIFLTFPPILRSLLLSYHVTLSSFCLPPFSAFSTTCLFSIYSTTLFALHFSFSLLSTRQILSFFSFLPLLIKSHSPVRFLCSPASLFCYLLLCFSPVSFRFSISVHLFRCSDRYPYSPASAFPCFQPFLLHSSAFCLFSFFLSPYFPLSLKPFLSGMVNGRSEFKRQRATSFFQSISPRLLLFSLNRATSV